MTQPQEKRQPFDRKDPGSFDALVVNKWFRTLIRLAGWWDARRYKRGNER